MTQPPAPNPILAVWTTPFEAPPFAQIAPEAFRDAFEEALAAHDREIDAIAADRAPPSFENTRSLRSSAADGRCGA